MANFSKEKPSKKVEDKRRPQYSTLTDSNDRNRLDTPATEEWKKRNKSTAYEDRMDISRSYQKAVRKADPSETMKQIIMRHADEMKKRSK